MTLWSQNQLWHGSDKVDVAKNDSCGAKGLVVTDLHRDLRICDHEIYAVITKFPEKFVLRQKTAPLALP
ncbi:hypothetical protein [uncultured Shimia sp.]|uniref:hypothetical protein n=1 Tax=uncultured Shimia sp. TaxID=573152 RepID=UPI00262586F5|nr:hypothetical protein [uncultured Shimia sp.]